MSGLLISICIPCYNSRVVDLCQALTTQIEADHLPMEIVVIDDCSSEKHKKQNKTIEEIPNLRYIELAKNIGRSKIRNAFLDYSQGKYLLFIDGDSAIMPFFLKKYVDFLRSNDKVEVLVGASIYTQTKPVLKYMLRWKYSRSRESLSYNERKKANYGGFKSNNFVILKTLFDKVKFDERIVGYGHEDTLFGYFLEQKKVSIEHIDNPVLNLHLDSNTVFLEKTKNAVQNLLFISNKLNHSKEWVESQRLLRIFLFLRSHFWGRLILKINDLNGLWYWSLLKSGRAPLFIFDLYRLSWMSKNRTLLE